MSHVFDRDKHKARLRRVGDEDMLLYDIPWEGHSIWGATAGMLLTFVRMVQESAGMTRRTRRRSARWRGCWASCGDCATPRRVVPGTGSRISRVSRRTRSKRRTRLPKPSRAANRGRSKAELGDLLFQVVFHAQMGAERQWFDFASVADSIADKLTERAIRMYSPMRVSTRSPIRIARGKNTRRANARQRPSRRSELADVPLALPALARAAKLGKRAGRVGFDWPDVQRRARRR